MPHVHLQLVQQQQHPRQAHAQSQQQHQANQAPSASFVAGLPEQPQALISPCASTLPSQDQQSVSTNQQQHLQSCPPQQSPDIHQQQSSQHSQNESESQPQSTGGSSGAAATSQNSDGRKISCEDIQLVQNLIERCLQLYMNQGEVISTLLNQAKIEPGFTSLVWQKLEEQNSDFFKAYYTRLKLKKHITLFNHLLDQQVQLMQKMRMLPTKTTFSPPMPNYPSIQGVTIGFPISQQSPVTGPGHIHVASMSASPQQSPSLLHGELHMQDSFQSSHENSRQTGMVEMEVPSVPHSSCSGLNSDLQLAPNSAIANGGAFPFNPITTSLDMSSIGIGLSTPMPLDTSFCTQDPHAQNVMSLSFNSADGDGNGSRDLLGALGHLPRNFSLSDLTAELGSHSDLGSFGSYSSPFATLETENFLQSPDKDNYDDSKLLDAIEEPLDMEFSGLN